MTDSINRNSLSSFGTDTSYNDDYFNGGLIVSSSGRSSRHSPSHFLSFQRQHSGAEPSDEMAYQQPKGSRQSECPYVGEGELNGRRQRDESVDDSGGEQDDDQKFTFLNSWMRRYPVVPPSKQAKGNGSTSLTKAPLEEQPSTSSHKYATLSADTLEPDRLYTSRSEAEFSDRSATPLHRNDRSRGTSSRIMNIDPSKQPNQTDGGDQKAAEISTQATQNSLKGVRKFPPVRRENKVAPYNSNIPQIVAEKENSERQQEAAAKEGAAAASAATVPQPSAAETLRVAGKDSSNQNLSNDYDDLNYKTHSGTKSPSLHRRYGVDDNIKPYHVTSNSRFPQSDSDIQLGNPSTSGNTGFMMTSPSGTRPFNTAYYQRAPSPTSATCVSCFGVRSKPYNAAKLAAMNSAASRQTSSPSPDGQLLDSKSCKSYHRLTLILSLIAAMLSMAALAITLLVFLGVLSTGRDDCMCTMNQGQSLGAVGRTAVSPVPTGVTSSTTSPYSNPGQSNSSSCPQYVCQSAPGPAGPQGTPGSDGQEGPAGKQGPVGPTSVLAFNRTMPVQFQCRQRGWIQYGSLCFGEAEQGSVFSFTAGQEMCKSVTGVFEAKPLVITSYLMAMMAYQLTNGREVWLGVRYDGDGGYTVTNDERAVTREFNASPVKSSLPTTQSGCDYISGFNHTSPSLSPIVRRGPCGESTKRPALCSISFPKLEV